MTCSAMSVVVKATWHKSDMGPIAPESYGLLWLFWFRPAPVGVDEKHLHLGRRHVRGESEMHHS